MTASSIRARVRAEMLDEIKAIARRHLAEQGANLSLRAVARDLGMVSSAIYRYYPSRDELLTALILDAYHALGAAVETAEAAVPRSDPTGRWLAACHAVRDWALARPHEYALIYGTPVPGYRAPGDTVPAASRSTAVLGRILQDAAEAGTLRDAPGGDLPAEVDADVARIGEALCPAVPHPVLSRALGAWVQLFGMISFELFGQFANTIEARTAFFDHQMRVQAEVIGLNGPVGRRSPKSRS
jgi:AcrR family transcriptional regulator